MECYRVLYTPYSRMSLRMTLSDPEWLSEILRPNDMKHRAVFPRQLSFLFISCSCTVVFDKYLYGTLLKGATRGFDWHLRAQTSFSPPPAVFRSRDSSRNLAIANRSRVSCAHKVTGVSRSLKWPRKVTQGHRNSEMSRFSRAQMISYYRSVETMVQFCIVSHI